MRGEVRVIDFEDDLQEHGIPQSLWREISHVDFFNTTHLQQVTSHIEHVLGANWKAILVENATQENAYAFWKVLEHSARPEDSALLARLLSKPDILFYYSRELRNYIPPVLNRFASELPSEVRTQVCASLEKSLQLLEEMFQVAQDPEFQAPPESDHFIRETLERIPGLDFWMEDFIQLSTTLIRVSPQETDFVQEMLSHTLWRGYPELQDNLRNLLVAAQEGESAVKAFRSHFSHSHRISEGSTSIDEREEYDQDSWTALVGELNDRIWEEATRGTTIHYDFEDEPEYDEDDDDADDEDDDDVVIPPTADELARQQRTLQTYMRTPFYQEAREKHEFRLEPPNISEQDAELRTWNFSSHGSSIRVRKMGSSIVGHGDFTPLGKARFHPKYPNLFLMMGYRSLKDFIEFAEKLSESEGVEESAVSLQGMTNGRMAETLRMFGFDVDPVRPRKKGERLKDKDRAQVRSTLPAIKAAVTRFEQQQTRPSREVPQTRSLLQILTERAFREIERPS